MLRYTRSIESIITSCKCDTYIFVVVQEVYKLLNSPDISIPFNVLF